MHEWKYIWASFYTIIIVFIKLVHNQDYPASESDDITTTERMLSTHEVLENEEVNIEITDESKVIRIYLVGGPQLRSALKNRDRIWKNGIIPYKIDDSFREENKDFILNVIEEFHNKTCVRFKPRINEKSYIFIMPGSGCSAGLGQGSRVNPVKLSVRGCFVKGIVIHELMHTLGFIHEQNRPDRDDFVKIDFGNILPGAEANFKKYSENQVNTFNQTYDYGSVMHYGAFDFAIDRRRPTIVPLQTGVKIGQRNGFSEMDLIRINLLYNCNERNTTSGNNDRNAGAAEGETRDENEEKEEKFKRFRLFFLLFKLF